MNNVIKRLFDIVGSSVLLLVTTPLFAMIYGVLVVSGSRPIFKQQRLGRWMQPFAIYKFTTMVRNADDYLSDHGLPTRDRITRVGKILRKTSLDELPQLFNILRGDMSFVGPRPVLESWRHKFHGDRTIRFTVRPGITGLAQINGRNTIPWSKRIEYDMEYTNTQSLALDIKILFKTFMQIIIGSDIVMDRNSGTMDDL